MLQRSEGLLLAVAADDELVAALPEPAGAFGFSTLVDVPVHGDDVEQEAGPL